MKNATFGDAGNTLFSVDNGIGYSNHLLDSDLSLSERIIQVADVASVLIYRCSYKNALDKNVDIDILIEQ